MDQFDKDQKDNNLLARIEKLERDLENIMRRNVQTARLSNLSNDMGDLQVRAVDENGLTRTLMSAYDLYDEFGIHAHFAGLNADGKPQFWMSADDGSGAFAGGAANISVEGLKFLLEYIGVGFQSSSGLTRVVQLMDDTGTYRTLRFSLATGLVANTNPGFETGDFTGWVSSGSDHAVVEDPYEGVYGCEWTAAGSSSANYIAYQPTSKRWLVTFYAKLKAGTAGPLNITANANFSDSVCVVDSEEWKRYCVFTNGASGDIRFFASGAGVVIDLVEFYEVTQSAGLRIDGETLKAEVSAPYGLYADPQVSPLPLGGFAPYAFPIGYDQADPYGSTINLAAGVMGLIPIFVPAPMVVRAAKVTNADASGARSWNWVLYTQKAETGLASQKDLTMLGKGFSNDSFTGSGAQSRACACNAFYCPPGVHWLGVQNVHGSNGFLLRTQGAGAGAVNQNIWQTMSGLGTLPTTIDATASATKRSQIPTACLQGEVFGVNGGF